MCYASTGHHRLYESLERFHQNQDQKTRLMRYAEYRANRVRVHLPHVDADDLYQEALLRTADSRRTWEAGDDDDLYWHLRQTISSVANQWVRQNYQRNLDLPGDVIDPLVPGVSNIHMRRLADALMRWFEANDAEAVKVLTLLQCDYKPREIQQELSLSATHYDRIRKRISRHGQEFARRKGLYSFQ